MGKTTKRNMQSPARGTGIKRRPKRGQVNKKQTTASTPEVIYPEHLVQEPTASVSDSNSQGNEHHSGHHFAETNNGGPRVTMNFEGWDIMESEAPPSQNTSIFDEIGEHVPEKLKEKIWDGKFIDLSLLLKSARELEDMAQGNGELKLRDGRLVLEKETKNKTIYNIEAWTSAFLIYTSVMLEKHPTKAQELLKYMRDIRMAAKNSKSAAWVKYDEQFRLKRAKYPTSSWGKIDGELWLLSMSCSESAGNSDTRLFNRQQPFSGDSSFRNFQNPISSPTLSTAGNPSSFQQTRPPFRKVFHCWGYNKGKCTYNERCKFSHTCSKCSGRHPAFSCRQ